MVVLDPVQMLDQQVRAPGLVAQQSPNLFLRSRIDLTALFGVARPAPPATGVPGCLTFARNSQLRLRELRSAEFSARCGELAPMPST